MKFYPNDSHGSDDPWDEVDFADPDLHRALTEADAEIPPAWLEPVDELADVQGLVRHARKLQAQQDRIFDAVLTDAAADPVPWCGPDPTAAPGYEPPEGLTAGSVRARRRDIAVRAAAADIGVRVHLADGAVRARAHRARVLATRCPRVWQAYLDGDVSEQNAQTAATLAASLPADPDAWAIFDEAIAVAATTTAPGRFRLRARAARERAHPETVDERHTRAASARTVQIETDLDGMATFYATVPAAKAIAIDRRLETEARHLAEQHGETRTLAQIRADIFTDLLTATPTNGSKTGAIVHLTIPVMTLLGHDDTPATLDGYGPIDLETARRLAGEATSWIRVLTHPISGTVLDVDRRTYRVPAALRRWLGVMHPTCVHPGCTRPAHLCDIDHLTRWADGGTTSAANTAPLCASHHPVKDESLWSVHRDPQTAEVNFTSPTGYTAAADPPPF